MSRFYVPKEAVKGNRIIITSDEAIALRDALRPFKGGRVVIAIGPEGDYTPGEVRPPASGR